VVVKDEELGKQVYFLQNSVGAVLGPQDCWLLMRGIKTLKARMDMHQKGAAKLAEWLQGRPEVKEIFFPGLPGHPGREIHDSQADGPGGIVSFRLQTEEITKKFLGSVRLPVLVVSLGGVESIITYPVTMSHAAMHPDHRKRVGVTGDLVRFSVGIEDPDDLIEDLDAALRQT
jgi:cystathionine beta-lyase